MKKLLLLLMVAAVTLVTSCKDEDDCDTSGVTYTNTVKEIFDTNCALSGCHSAAELTTQGSLETYEHAVIFVSFDRILGAINHTEGFTPMPNPPGTDQLDECTIDQIEAWITDGTPL